MGKKKCLDEWALRIMANGSFSTWMLVRSRVLRGSSLRQILLNIFISNLEKAMERTLSKSADDDARLPRPGGHQQACWSIGLPFRGAWTGS